MPRRKEGFTQLGHEMPDEILAESKRAAAEAGVSLSTWITARCAEAVGLEYAQPKLGRPGAEQPPPAKPAKPKRRKAPEPTPAPGKRRGKG